MDKLPKEIRKLSRKKLKKILLQAINEAEYFDGKCSTLEQRLLDIKQSREDMRDAVVDQPSFLDLYKGVSPHTIKGSIGW